MRWLLRLAAVFLGVGIADALVVLLAPRPLPWAAIIAALAPLLTVVVVIIPMMKADKR